MCLSGASVIASHGVDLFKSTQTYCGIGLKVGEDVDFEPLRVRMPFRERPNARSSVWQGMGSIDCKPSSSSWRTSITGVDP